MGLTRNQDHLLHLLAVEARKMNEAGRILSGIIGELSACKILNMTWEPRTGYDAVDQEGKRIEIKTRRDSKNGKVNPNGTMGFFKKVKENTHSPKRKYVISYGLYVELDKNFKAERIIKISLEKIKQLEKHVKSNGQIRVGRIINAGQPIPLRNKTT